MSISIPWFLQQPAEDDESVSNEPDPADMGTAFGMEYSLATQPATKPQPPEAPAQR